MRAFYEMRGPGGRTVAEVHVTQEHRDEAIVTYVYVDPASRGRGLGVKMMQSVLADADEERVTLLLEPVPFGRFEERTGTFTAPTMDPDTLRAWYRQFGFRKQHGPWMIRGPRRGRK